MTAKTGQPVSTLWRLQFEVNGTRYELDVEPTTTLLQVLRMELGLTGTKGACLEGECGSCTVLVDGRPMNSCLILAPQVQGRRITTIEGLAANGSLDIVQRKFLEKGAVQCGYCTPGLILSAKHFIDTASSCSDEAIHEALEGNLCRCTGYAKIIEAVREAFQEARGKVGK